MWAYSVGSSLDGPPSLPPLLCVPYSGFFFYNRSQVVAHTPTDSPMESTCGRVTHVCWEATNGYKWLFHSLPKQNRQTPALTHVLCQG